MKVLHLPTAVGGNSWALSQGERQLGLDSQVLVAVDSWLQYPADKYLFHEMPKGVIGEFKYVARAMREVMQIRNGYDIFHFNFGSSFLNHFGMGINNWDLPLYKGRIAVTYNGCDARMKFDTIKSCAISACSNSACNAGICNDGKRDRNRACAIQKFDQYANGIFALNPDLLNFLPERAKFLPYAILPGKQTELTKPKLSKEPLKIVHAPTNREVKGTCFLLEAIEKVKKKYGKDSVELLLIEGVTHNEAMKKYMEADVVVDQLLVGWYGAFACEVMMLKKPVIVYVREEDMVHIPSKMWKDLQYAIINANPNTIYDKISEIVENRDILLKIAGNAYEYVNTYHDYFKVAQITKMAYEQF